MHILPRLQLFEFNDQSFCPDFIRSGLMDFLTYYAWKKDTYGCIGQLFNDFVSKSENHNLIELCSGAAQSVPFYKRYISPISDFKLTLTDKYPDEGAFLAAANSRLSVKPVLESIDVFAAAKSFRGQFIIFSSFHHFNPEMARQLLGDIARAGNSIAVFEFSQRSVLDILKHILGFPLIWALYPFFITFNWKKIFFCWFVPLIPLVILWDGIISCLRTYTVEELREMTNSLGIKDYEWTIGQRFSWPTFSTITYLTGAPINDGRNRL